VIPWYWAVAGAMLAGLMAFGFGALLSNKAIDEANVRIDALELKAMELRVVADRIEAERQGE